jgi:NAD(P)H-dependent FMN reductase
MSGKYIVVLSCSLKSGSKSREIARAAIPLLKQQDFRVEWVDLRDLPLPFCDAEGCYENANVQKLTEIVTGASAVVFAAPIYNFDVSAATKNVIELVGDALQGKAIAMLCAASGMRSAMAPYSFMNSLMLDFKCLVVPSIVIVDSKSFGADGRPVDEVEKRVGELVSSLHQLIRVGL